jgi:hypothetical protein
MVLTSLTNRERGIGKGDFMSCTQRNGADSFLRSRQLCAYSRISPTFYGTRRFIILFTTAFHLSLTIHPSTLRSTLILPFHLRLGLSSGLILLSHQKPCIHYSSPHACYMSYTSHPPWLEHSNYVRRRVQVVKLLIMQFSPTSLRSKYSPQHPVLKHPQSMFFPQKKTKKKTSTFLTAYLGIFLWISLLFLRLTFPICKGILENSILMLNACSSQVLGAGGHWTGVTPKMWPHETRNSASPEDQFSQKPLKYL